MKAKTIYDKCAVFDLDDTLIKSEGVVYVYKNGIFTKTLSPHEYSTYIKKPNEILDFSDFRNGELIVTAKKYKAWPLLEELYSEDMEIYILTARSPALKPYIHKLLLNNNIDIDNDHIITIGDDKGDIDIAKEKKKILKMMSEDYDEILFFDDDKRNILLASSVPGVQTKLIENVSFQRGLDPKDAMNVGDIEGRKMKGITGLLNEFGMKLIKIDQDYNSTTVFFNDKNTMVCIFAIYEADNEPTTFLQEFSYRTKPDGLWHYQKSSWAKTYRPLMFLRKRLIAYQYKYKNKQ